MAFRIRTEMVEKIPGNYKNMYKKNKDGLKCSRCTEEIMTQIHCISCPGMKVLREGLDLVNMTDMVTYFKRILKERGHKWSKLLKVRLDCWTECLLVYNYMLMHYYFKYIYRYRYSGTWISLHQYCISLASVYLFFYK